MRLDRLPIDAECWQEYVSRSPDATPFHLPAWARTVSDAYRYRASVLVVRDAIGSVRGGLPLVCVSHLGRQPRWVALPFTDRCAPLLDPDVAAADFVRLLEAARIVERPARIEVRAELTGSAASVVGRAYYHRLDLRPGPAAVRAGFHPSQVRRNIVRARKGGVTVLRGRTEADLTRTFYRLHTLTRRRLGVPVQPRHYFSVLWSHMLQPGHGFLLTAVVDDRPAASAVFLAHGGNVVYKYGASDPALRHTRANHLLFDQAIEYAGSHGFRTFDFGRTDLADESLRTFKARWGAEESVEGCSVLGQGRDGGTQQVPSFARTVLRIAPPQLARWTGEALYRWTA